MKGSVIGRFYRSVFFRSMLLLIATMSIVVIGGIHIFTVKQASLVLDWNNNRNVAQTKHALSRASDEMTQFGDKLSLLAKTSEIQSMEPTIAAGYLKSYSVSSLFISGEHIAIYNNQDKLVCDNSMIGTSTEPKYPIDLRKFTPHRPYITPWYRNESAPERIFGAAIVNRSSGDGGLIASFSIRRLWKTLSEYKVGKNGFLVAVNSTGEILYHPDLKDWLNGIHKIGELGLKDIDPSRFSVNGPLYVTLNDHKQYLLNYAYEPIYDFGLLSLQPKSEIDELVSSVQRASYLITFVAIIVILFIATWMFFMLGRPLNKLTSHIKKINDNSLDIEQIDFGKRKDEIGLLSRAFNQMHSTIQKQVQELDNHRKMLEQEVYERTQELELANKKLDMISRTDELTGLPNRRDMNETINNEVGRSLRTNKPFSFIFVDIDHFKAINDTFGHACGDVVLKAVSQTVRGLLRKYDIFARYGGEEFLTLLPETDLDGAAIVAERFRKKIERMIVHYASHEITLTITLGVSIFDPKLGADRSIQMADKALYQGKESGRNQVVIWKPEWITKADYEAAAIEMAEASKNEAQLATTPNQPNSTPSKIVIEFKDE